MDLSTARARIHALLPILDNPTEAETRETEMDQRIDDLVTAAAPVPSRFNATPAEVDAYLRTILTEDTYLRFQQAIGEHALAEAVEDAGTVRAPADNDGLYNADWRKGWDDAIDRVDPEQNGPTPARLIDLRNS